MNVSEYRRARCTRESRRTGRAVLWGGGPGASWRSSSSIGVGGIILNAGGIGGLRGFFSGESTVPGTGRML